MGCSPDSGSFVPITGAASAGSTVQVVASDGTVVGEFTPEYDIQSVLFASADLADGATYSMVVNGAEVGTGVEGTVIAQQGPGGQQGGPRP